MEERRGDRRAGQYRPFDIPTRVPAVIITANGVTTIHFDVPFPLYNWPDSCLPPTLNSNEVKGLRTEGKGKEGET